MVFKRCLWDETIVDFNYDLNGNLIHDDMNKNIEINYDHRNLITDMKHWSTTLSSRRLVEEYWSEGQIITSRIYYYYDDVPACRSSAQAGGYLIHGRNFDANVAKYKFTGKERDKESNYDYFGARYYDARIGRWGQVEPLMEKYLMLSPYVYAANNPLLYLDYEGKDIYIEGKDANEVIKQLRKETGLKFAYDKSTGKLTITGKAKSKLAELLLGASTNNKIDIKLITTRANTASDFIVGKFLGSEISNDKIVAKQEFNIEQAEVWESVGGSSIGLSAMHEIVEAFIGASLFPGEGNSERTYEWSHFLTRMLEIQEGEEQFYPKEAWDPGRGLYYLIDKEEKYHPIK